MSTARYRALFPGLAVTASIIVGAAACRNATSPPPPPSSATVAASPAAPATPPAGPRPIPSPVAPLSPNARTEDERNTIAIFRQAAPSVVFVTQKKVVVDWFAGVATEVPAGSGSGFIWDAAGHVVTNYHVVKDARSLAVTLYDHKTYPARLVGAEPKKDIAVLRLESAPDGLVPIQVPEARASLEVGQKTVAIGNPFGLDQTLTTGIVSALGREVLGIGGVTIRDMIQTDAAINPGNSGGPLLDSAGRLIGMNTLIYSRSGASAGIGFAVPASAIARVVPQLIKFGRVKAVGMGIRIDPAGRLERRLRLKGVLVLSVTPNSPAERAGLRGLTQTPNGIELGDVIVGIDDRPVDDYDDLYNALDGKDPGTRVRAKLLRAKGVETVEVELVVVD